MTSSEPQPENGGPISEQLMAKPGPNGKRLPPGKWRFWCQVVLIGRLLFCPGTSVKNVMLPLCVLRMLAGVLLCAVALLVALGVTLGRGASQPCMSQSPLPQCTPCPTVACPNLSTGVPVVLAPTPQSRKGAVAFTLWRQGNADVYVLDQAQEQLLRLTYDPAIDRQPTWSPDGNYLAFASNRAHNWDLYLLDLSSGALIRLTDDAEFDANPAWSPDGERIAFEGYRQGNLDLYVLHLASGNIQRITTDPAPDFSPTWSPDGEALAFVSFRDGNKDIFVVQLRDGKTINVTQSPDLDENDPAWSPDGTYLAYTSGQRGDAAVQIAPFSLLWEASEPQTKLFGSGHSPVWSPDGRTLLYVYERGQRSHLVAADVSGWALFHEVYSVDGVLSDVEWGRVPLSQRVIARAQAAPSGEEPHLFVELLRPTPASGPPYRLVELPVEGTDKPYYLSDRVNESFNALRQRVLEEVGWDFLGRLSSAWQPITYTPPSGHSRMSWHLCGRAIGLDQTPYAEREQRIELVREDIGGKTYWRVFVRASRQDGSMGEPLREAPWDLWAREKDARGLVEGGAYKEMIPAGYYVDFTALAETYGWERVPALWRWRHFWPDIRWWEYQRTDGISWWTCMLEIYDRTEIEKAFGPVPGLE